MNLTPKLQDNYSTFCEEAARFWQIKCVCSIQLYINTMNKGKYINQLLNKAFIAADHSGMDSKTIFKQKCFSCKV